MSECIPGSHKTRRLNYQWLHVSWRHGIDHKEFKGRSSRIGKGFSWCNSREEPGVSDLWEKRHARGWKRSRRSVSRDLSRPASSTHARGWRPDAFLFINGVTATHQRRTIHAGVHEGVRNDGWRDDEEETLLGQRRGEDAM